MLLVVSLQRRLVLKTQIAVSDKEQNQAGRVSKSHLKETAMKFKQQHLHLSRTPSMRQSLPAQKPMERNSLNLISLEHSPTPQGMPIIHKSFSQPRLIFILCADLEANDSSSDAFYAAHDDGQHAHGATHELHGNGVRHAPCTTTRTETTIDEL